jgi:hypothetical protein
MNTSLPAVMILVSTACCGSAGAEPPSRPASKSVETEFSVQVERAEPPTALHIAVMLKNNSGSDVQIHPSVLPWRFPYGLKLLVTSPDGTEGFLTPTRSIADPPSGTATWRNGEVLKGEIDLSQRFSGLGDALRHDDAVLLWVFRPHVLFVDESIEEHIGTRAGAIVIPRTNAQ